MFRAACPEQAEGLNMPKPMKAESQLAGARVEQASSILTIGGAWRIRRLICRLLLAGFCLGLPRCFFGFSVSRTGTFLRFPADSLGGFLGLSANSLGRFFRFLSDCFSSFLGFFARSFNPVFDCFPCFFCSVLHLFHSPFLPKSNERRRRDQSNNQAHYFHDCLLFDLFSLYIENG